MTDAKVRQKKASQTMSSLHLQISYENGDHPEEVDTAYSLAADALLAVAPLRANLESAAARADAAEAKLAAEGWQPIETAPKDRKARLVWAQENRCTYCVSWREDLELPGGGGWTIFGGGWRDTIQRVTHWMPLPAPPALIPKEGA